MHNISLKDVGEIEVVIAPMDEQRRIVAKLEKLLEKVESSRTRLEKIPAIPQTFSPIRPRRRLLRPAHQRLATK